MLWWSLLIFTRIIYQDLLSATQLMVVGCLLVLHNLLCNMYVTVVHPKGRYTFSPTLYYSTVLLLGTYMCGREEEDDITQWPTTS